MAKIDARRIVARLDGELVSTGNPLGDWESPYATPGLLCAVQVTVLEGRHSSQLPVGWVTPWVVLDYPGELAPVSSGQFQVMNGVRVLVFRASVIPPASESLFEGGGGPDWGLRLHLLKGVKRARFVYWQYE